VLIVAFSAAITVLTDNRLPEAVAIAATAAAAPVALLLGLRRD